MLPVNILVVEDEHAIARLIEFTLEQAGFRVICPRFDGHLLT